MSLTFGLFTQVSGSGPLGPLVYYVFEFSQFKKCKKNENRPVYFFLFSYAYLLGYFMPPTSKKLRGHIGLGCPPVCPSVLRNTFRQLRNSRTAYARILKVYMCHVHEK